jgi:protein gp37
MSEKSAIQWTDATWNIARGCTKVDEDCRFCYMYRDSFESTRYNPLQVVRTKTVFNLPLKLKEPSKIFTCSLTDFFHVSIDSYRDEAWDIIRKCPQHTFQILTKRPERIKDCLPNDWNENFNNVWIGTSVGSDNGIKRIYDLMDAFNEFKNGGLELRKPVTFISFEPLHEYIDCNFDISTIIWFDWIIIGGESGNETGKYRYRPCELKWIEEIANSFSSCGVAVFIKQMGTYLSKQLKMSDRHGGNINEFPEHLRIREFPKTLVNV